MVSFEVQADTAAVKALMAQLEPAEIDKRGRAALTEATAYLKGEVQKGTPVDRGIGRGSVVASVNGTALELTGKVMSVEEHMVVLELGRRPGAKPPPTGPIRAWLARHGSDPKLAFVVARAIGKRGMPARHMFQQAAERGKGTVESIILRHFRF